jgi:hypothetical protein
MLLDRGIEHDHVGRQVLLARDATGQDGPRVVLQDRDAVDALVVHAMIQVADVARPELVTPSALTPYRRASGRRGQA